jgi:hypothetical protein
MSYIRFGGPTSYFTASAATDLWTAPSSIAALPANTQVWFYCPLDSTGTGVGLPSPIIQGSLYYISASGLTTTQFKISNTSGGATVNLLTDSSASIWMYYDSVTAGGAGFAPDMVNVPTADGLGNVKTLINAAIFARRRKPQPFLSSGISAPQIWGVWAFGDGYVGVPYLQEWYIENTDRPVVYTLQSGSLPAGLSLLNIGSSAQGRVSGTPTLAGTYPFTLRATLPTSTFQDQSFSITITADPNEGYSFIGGA